VYNTINRLWAKANVNEVNVKRATASGRSQKHINEMTNMLWAKANVNEVNVKRATASGRSQKHNDRA